MVVSPDARRVFLRIPKCATTAASGFLCSQGWRMPSVYAHATAAEAVLRLRQLDDFGALAAVQRGAHFASLRSPTAWYSSLFQHVNRLGEQPHPFQAYREGRQDWSTWLGLHAGTWTAMVSVYLERSTTLINVQTPADFAIGFAEVCEVPLKTVNDFGLHNTAEPGAPAPTWTRAQQARVQLADGALCARLDVDVETGPRWALRAC